MVSVIVDLQRKATLADHLSFVVIMLGSRSEGLPFSITADEHRAAGKATRARYSYGDFQAYCIT